MKFKIYIESLKIQILINILCLLKNADISNEQNNYNAGIFVFDNLYHLFLWFSGNRVIFILDGCFVLSIRLVLDTSKLV